MQRTPTRAIRRHRMDNDDQMIGRILSRREVLKLVGLGSAALLVGCGTPEPTSTAQSTTAAGSAATAAPTLNAEAATVAAMEGDPSAIATLESEVATAEAANTEIASAVAADGTTVA